MKLNELVEIERNDSIVLDSAEEVIKSYKTAKAEFDLAKGKIIAQSNSRLKDDVNKIAETEEAFSLEDKGETKIIKVGNGGIKLKFNFGFSFPSYSATIQLYIYKDDQESQHSLGMKPKANSDSQRKLLSGDTVTMLESNKLDKKMIQEVIDHTKYLVDETVFLNGLNEFEYFAYDLGKTKINVYPSFKDALESVLTQSPIFKKK